MSIHLNTLRSPYRHTLPRNQRGVVLFIALIVLLAMTLAGIGLMRSVTTGNLVAGNLAFKLSTVNAAEPAIQDAYSWLTSKIGTPVLDTTDATHGYFSAQGTPNWSDNATWSDAYPALPTADAAGNTVRVLIHRMCINPNAAYNATGNQCALDASSTQGSGSSMTIPPIVYNTKSSIYYRITARVQGPRNTQSFIQAMVLLPL